MIGRHFEKLNDIVKVIEATRGLRPLLALNGPRGFDEEMSGSRTSSEWAALSKWKSEIRQDHQADGRRFQFQTLLGPIDLAPCQTAPELQFLWRESVLPEDNHIPLK